MFFFCTLCTIPPPPPPDGLPDEWCPGWAADGEGGPAALCEGAGSRAVLPQAAERAAAELPGAGERQEQEGAGSHACTAAATGVCVRV